MIDANGALQFPASPLARSRPGLAVAPSALVAAAAGFLTPFTVSLVGEMPVGELILMMAAGWLALCMALNRAWPAEGLRSPYLWALLGAQAIALTAYVVSDFHRGSSPHDMARGWARMIFLAVDVAAVAFLVACNPRNFLWMLAGQLAGDSVNALVFGALFGDIWKFGVGTPLTYLALVAGSLAGAWGAVAAALAMGLVNFGMDFRSFGAMSGLAGAITVLQMAPRRARLWLAPACAVVAIAGVLWVYARTHQGEEKRATRSDISRSSMVLAAVEAFAKSPLIGSGSWFSNTDVYDNFFLIQLDAAHEAGVGGFAEANSDPGSIALHSQILVALAEGGIFGATLFFVFGAGLAWALWFAVFVRPWDRLCPIYLLSLLVAAWNLFLSPFSGAHRVYIAMAAGLILALQAERRELKRGEASA